MKKKAAKFVGFVPYKMDGSIQASVKEKDYDDETLIRAVVALTNDGCRVAFSYEEDTNAYHVYANRVENGRPDSGLILSARHSDLRIAMTLLIVLDGEVYGGEWPSPEKAADQYDW